MILDILLTFMISASDPFAVRDTVERIDTSCYVEKYDVQDSLEKHDVKKNIEDDVKEDVMHEGYWKRKKYFRISFNDTKLYPLNVDEPYPSDFALGLDFGRNFFLHMKPIADMLRFGLDVGFDFNYMRLDSDLDLSDYEGPYGYTGSEPTEEGGDLSFLTELGGNQLSLGLAVGPSVTLNPIDKMRVSAYVHFVPSVSLLMQGMSFNAGFSPCFMKYGLEVSYGLIGLGMEYNSGMSTYIDAFRYFEVKANDRDTSDLYRARYFTQSLQFYLSFRLGHCCPLKMWTVINS